MAQVPHTPHATPGQVKAAIRRAKRRHPEHEHQGLNIYPMMDMMTILLVFLVMQFASSTAALVTESEDLKIPYSSSEMQLGDAVPVQLARNSIVVDGHEVLQLRNGTIDPAQKQGGANGFLVTPLHREMCRVRDVRKQIARMSPTHPFSGEAQLIVDRRTPFRTLSEVIYTLGQCEFSKMRFMTHQNSH